MALRKIMSGMLRHKILIQKNNESSTNLDSLGRQVITEATHATVKGSISKLTGTERTVANQTFGACTHECMCWFVPGVTNKMWIQALNGKRFNIVDTVNVDEKSKELYLILNSESS